MTPIEAMADAVMSFEGWIPKGQVNAVPNGSRSWRNRNPGNLRPYSSAQPRDADNYRIFSSLVDGYAALLADLSKKLHVDFPPTATLLDVMNKYAPTGDANNPTQYATFLCHRLTLSLGRPIDLNTTLGVFLNGPLKS